jgi:hypothetical protein
MARRPDLEGQQFQHISGTSFVYVVIDGILRWIPSPKEWNNLFTKWNVATIDLSGIDGFNDVHPPFPLPQNCIVVRGDQTPEVYFLDFQDHTNLASPLVKRWVLSADAMNAYGFRWPFGDPLVVNLGGGFGSSPPPIVTTIIFQVLIDSISGPNPPGPLPLGAGLPGFPF